MSSPGAQKITVRHEGTDRVFDSTQHVTVGRAPEVLLFVDSPLVSRVHATLTWQGSTWILSDNGSTNGVFVDAQRLDGPVPIERPTLVRLGDAVTGPLLHLVPDAARQAPPQRPAPSRGRPRRTGIRAGRLRPADIVSSRRRASDLPRRSARNSRRSVPRVVRRSARNRRRTGAIARRRSARIPNPGSRSRWVRAPTCPTST
ncbi:FHA domain-containing protein [Nocardia sp. N2S4-5]|uniref:FHA domain-containing protein n=1 Tax=Nocardia sp. N2S4-5 TaxID=3351565 RepID=UPI0037D212D0